MPEKKTFQGTNTLAYYAVASMTKKKVFETLTTGHYPLIMDKNRPKSLSVVSFSCLRLGYVKVLWYDLALILNIKLTEKSQRMNTLAYFTAASVTKKKGL